MPSPTHDVFFHTAQGKEWTWLGAIACAATAAVLLSSSTTTEAPPERCGDGSMPSRMITSGLAVLAVPFVGFPRSRPRRPFQHYSVCGCPGGLVASSPRQAMWRHGGFSGIGQFCGHPDWRIVYLDEVAAVLLRNQEATRQALERLQVDCATVQFVPPATRNRAELYNFYANAGWVLSGLGRVQEGLAALDHAGRLFQDDSTLPLTRGSVLQANGRIQGPK